MQEFQRGYNFDTYLYNGKNFRLASEFCINFTRKLAALLQYQSGVHISYKEVRKNCSTDVFLIRYFEQINCSEWGIVSKKIKENIITSFGFLKHCHQLETILETNIWLPYIPLLTSFETVRSICCCCFCDKYTCGRTLQQTPRVLLLECQERFDKSDK